MTFSELSCAASHCAGKPTAIGITLAFVAGWFVLDLPVDGINFIISIVSLVLLFLLQGSTNQEGAATQAKLDELIRVTKARNDLMRAEKRSEEEIEQLRNP